MINRSDGIEAVKCAVKGNLTVNMMKKRAATEWGKSWGELGRVLFGRAG